MGKEKGTAKALLSYQEENWICRSERRKKIRVKRPRDNVGKIKISVVIPAYNARKTIDNCLESVLRQDFSSYEIIVVDDGSTDGTTEKVMKYPVKLIRKSREGPSSARNAGAEVSEGDIVIFLDSDCVVQNDWLRNMVEPFQDPKTGATHGMYDIANSYSFVARLIFVKAKYVFRALKYLDFAWSFSLAIRKELFQQVGGFDTSFTVPSSEDIVLAYRIIKNHRKICLVRKARVLHFFPESISGHIKRQARMAKANILVIRKSKRFVYQQASIGEYIKLFLHGMTLLTLLFFPITPIPFIILLTLSLAGHLKLACWAMKENPRYILIIPFEFVTKLAWVVGAALGLWDLLWEKRTDRKRLAEIKS